MLFLLPAVIWQGLTTQVSKGLWYWAGIMAIFSTMSQAGLTGSTARSGREP